MTRCPYCDGPLDRQISRGGLTVTADPSEAYWQGERLPIPPTKARMLYALARNGKAHRDVLSGITSGVTANNVQVHISALRKLLVCLGVPMRIEAVPSWGFRLVFDEEPDEPRDPL